MRVSIKKKEKKKKKKKKKKKNIHMIVIITSRFDLFLPHDRMVTSKDTTLTTHSSVAHTYYIMSHQELDETSWLIFI